MSGNSLDFTSLILTQICCSVFTVGPSYLRYSIAEHLLAFVGCSITTYFTQILLIIKNKHWFPTCIACCLVSLRYTYFGLASKIKSGLLSKTCAFLRQKKKFLKNNDYLLNTCHFNSHFKNQNNSHFHM